MRTGLVMAMSLVTALATVVAAASASPPPLPGEWKPGTRWRVSIDDGAGKPAQTVTFRVEAEKAHSCLGGDWQRLVRVDGYYDNLSEPAWRIEGKHLTLLLASDICDNYDQLDGDIEHGRFSGRHSRFGIDGSDQLGSGVAEQVR